MESNDLRIFKAVALAGSITKAAQSLGYVQSNVTARIQHLETELKTQLFYRQHGMILTPAGEKLLTYTVQILHMLDDAKKALNDSGEPTGRLSIVNGGVVTKLHHILVGQRGLTLSLNNTATSADGRVLNEELATVLTIQNGLITKIDTYLSDVPMMERYFVKSN